jgi:ribosomal-protein-alanine N-acetyltransferase
MEQLTDNYFYKTPNLTIRFYNKKDFPKWQKLFSDMKEKQNQWDWEKENIESLNEERFYKKLNKHKHERQKGNIYYFCVENNQNDLIGICLIKEIEKTQPISAEIGFQLNNRYWGKGLGTELAQGVVGICKSDLQISDLRALVNKGNSPSIHILEKIGMKKIDANETQWIFN